MGIIKIKQNLCKQDGICAQECPVMIISLDGASKYPETISGFENRCIKCGHCVSICPHGALSLEELAPADCAPYKSELHPSNDQIEQLIKHRRSIRNFKDKKVDRDILDKLIDIARYAPTGGNSQQVQWLVYDNPETIKELASKVMEFFRKIADSGNPFAEKYNVSFLLKRWDAGNDVIFRGATALALVHSPKMYGASLIDNTIALSYLDLAASNFGLGTCWAGFFMIAVSQSPEFANFLDLPEGNICTGGLMLGYPKYKYHRIPERKEANIIWRN
jgi:nitroreductase/NAD-dependent dihydropyrimidine dehydrogenase PreA subunit